MPKKTETLGAYMRRISGKPAAVSVGQERLSARARGYTRTWEKLARMILARDPLCVECLKDGRTVPSEHADHIIPRSKGGPDSLENGQGLCHGCHSRKTRRGE